ncbi:histidine phosphatase family protein [Nocardia nova]|uniref:Histidine phosphatase family protein n=1 Tax=Nocardia nova TaxID=37330 RepID=A0A2S6AMH6_9NOCA|nr:histidine phosphatase family protein [Nocardia nova]PPJ36406.1 histidine phosphatase family protein [Nocardia nova]
MPLTELLLARHGEAVCNVEGIVGGERGCTGLTDRGRRQAAQLAERLRSEHSRQRFDAIYTTPRRRCAETAQIVTTVLGTTAVVDSDLRGADHGAADARAWRDVKDAFGGPPQHDPDRPYAEGAESWTAYLDRSTQALARIIAHHPGQRVLVLAHGETIEAANTLLLGLPAGTCTRARFVTDHASLTRWQLHTNRLGHRVWMLCAHNDTTHLAEDHNP